MPTRLLIATSNPHKVQEIAEILGSSDVQIEGLDGCEGVTMPEETGSTFLENARIKARSVAEQTGRTALADDSGICIDALAGEPGVRSNRFLGEQATAEERNNAILSLLAGRPPEERGARFVCAACIAFPSGETVEALETCSGVIARRPSGGGGFGYDPIFYFPEYNCTLAEVSSELENNVSHRGKAVRRVVQLLKERSRGC